MRYSKIPASRLFVAGWFFIAVGVLAGGFLLQYMGWAQSMGLEAGSEMKIAAVLCAYMVGQGVGEWRGMNYAERLRAEARSAP